MFYFTCNHGLKLTSWCHVWLSVSAVAAQSVSSCGYIKILSTASNSLYNLPPWQQKIFSSIIAAIGRQLKQSVNVFHNFMLYLRLPATYHQHIIIIIISISSSSLSVSFTRLRPSIQAQQLMTSHVSAQRCCLLNEALRNADIITSFTPQHKF